jgi:hypothetical protein
VTSGGSTGTVTEDGDEDGYSGVFSDPSASFTSSGAVYGDRMSVVLNDSGELLEHRTYITRVVSETRIEFFPEIPQQAVVSWECERNSVSYALVEAYRIRQQAAELLEVTESFSVPQGTTLGSIASMFAEQGLDRAADLAATGNLSDLISSEVSELSYASKAMSAVEVVGSTTQTSAASSQGRSGTSSSVDNPSTAAMSSGPASDVDVRLALAKGLAEISASAVLTERALLSLDELKNRRIYTLTGEVVSGEVSDVDDTLPWQKYTGSELDQVTAVGDSLTAALQYMIDHPDEFDELE